MTYFLTGGTGFLGRNLIQELRRRRSGTLYVLVRRASRKKFEAMCAQWGVDGEAITPIYGDVEEPFCGVSEKDRASLAGRVTHFFHLAGIADLAESDGALLERTNVEGTRNALSLAKAMDAKCFHYVSSWVVAGKFEGIWTEQMYEAWGGSELPMFRSKHEAEGIVRREAKLPFRIYRPSVIVGRSDNGECGRPTGLYSVFKTLDRLRAVLPSWFPLPIVGHGRVNIVPVDYVAASLDYLAHVDGLEGRCFHLMNPDNEGFSDVLNQVARVISGPRFRLPIDSRVFDLIPKPVAQHVFRLMPPWGLLYHTLVDVAGIPPILMGLENHPTFFDSGETRERLEQAGIRCPSFERYADRVWDYWKRVHDPDLARPTSIEEVVRGKTVLVTGASSGIGLESAKQFARNGAKVLLVARSVDKLEELKVSIEQEGGIAFVYPADLSDKEQCQKLMARVNEEQGGVDVLVNNAGRSISRLLIHSLDRIHDFERTMALNYFAPVILTLGVIPHMREKRFGHIINVCSAGAQGVGPGFSAYCASKSAMDVFGHGARGELIDDGIYVTNIYMGLVYTPMSAPSPYFAQMNGLQPEQAADIVCQCVVHRKEVVSVEPTGAINRFIWAVWPKAAHVMLQASCRGYKFMVESGLALRKEFEGE